MEYRKTIFCDIDGTLVKHNDSFVTCLPSHKMEVLPGVKEAMREWALKEYKVILVTGRKESLREVTVKQLQEAGIPYDQLIMDVGRGIRVVINDTKPDGVKTAHAISLQRDSGLHGLEAL